MSHTEHNALAGAAAGRVAIIAIGPVAVAIADLMAKHEPFDFTITSVDVGDHVAEHVAAGVRPRSGTALPVPSSVLLIGDTAHADLTTQAVRALTTDRESNTRLRIWPVFVNGDPTKLNEFDATLDELPDVNCDGVLMLTQVPSPEQAARALLAWLTVKLPAPASVLGQMPDASGRICRYVALGSELVTAQSDAGEASGDGGDIAGSLATDAPGLELEAAALLRRLRAAGSDIPGIVELRERRAALDEAVQASELASVIEAHRRLVMAGDVEVGAQLEALASDLVATAASETGNETEHAAAPESEPQEPDQDDPGLAIFVVSPVNGAQAPTPPLAAALADYVVVAGKTGFGRLVSGGRRRHAAADLAEAADAFVTGVEQAWLLQGKHLLAEAILAAVEQARATTAVAAAAENAARATTAAAGWRERVESAVATGRTWQGVDASRVVRSWGAGAAAARRYVIGSGALLETVIDLTDGPEPCLRVVTQTHEPAVTVLTAQYGLPLSALS